MQHRSRFSCPTTPPSDSHSTTDQAARKTLKQSMLKKIAGGSMLPLLFFAAGANAASFTGIGIPEGNSQSRAYAISGDGTTVVGHAGSGSSAEAFYWTVTGGLVVLDTANGGIQFARGVSSDGSVIVGPDNGFDSFRWTADGGMQDIGAVNGLGGRVFANGVSADGSTIVGQNLFDFASGIRWDPFRWTTTSSATSLGFFPDIASNQRFATATAVSADGSIVVGDSLSVDGRRAFRWTESTGLVSLGALPRNDGNLSSTANAVSGNGEVIVGNSLADQGREAFLWTEAGGMIGLGELAGGDYSSDATGVSADGSIVVGQSIDGQNFNTPFLWDASNGMRSLKTLLEEEGLDLAGWELRATTGVSHDGTVITGWGTNPAGQTEGWVAQIDFVDSDGDGIPDSNDDCPLDPLNDADGDGVCGDVDSCPDGDETDSDGDGLADACDVCPADAANDADGDGICESIDNCPLLANAGQLDTDSDTEGDICDTDDDNDGYTDEGDNCPLQANDQADTDGDGAGDACDTDADADGVVDAEDACLLSPTGDVVNAGGCAVADLCPCSHNNEGEMWKNHRAYVKCVKRASRDFKRADLITKKERNALRKAARQSSCGRRNND